MKPSIRSKLEKLSERLEELSALLAQPDVINNQARFRALSKEYAELTPVVNNFQDYLRQLAETAAMQSMLKDDDPELRDLAKDELARGEQRQAELELELQRLLLPTDPNDDRNIFLEVRDFAGNIVS